jgi:hypothetical protein
MDNMKQQMEMLKSQDQMSKANIKIAGVQLRQAIGKSKEQVYKRLQAQEIRTTDVFHVVLDAKVTRLEGMTKKEKAKSEAGGKCKMIIPVKWTWNKLQSVCRKDQVQDIRNGLAQAAKQAQHTHWTKDYKDMATMGGAINPSREEFLVISTEKLICRIEEAEEQVKQQRHRLDQWSTQEQKTLAELEEQKQHEAWLEVKLTHRAETDAIATREANQEQMKRDALIRLQAWGKRAQNGRWLECPHGAVRIEGHQRRPYGFVMGDESPMPRCKNKKCVEQMKTFELSKKYQDALNKLKHQDTGKQSQDKSTGEVQVVEKTTTRRNTKMFKMPSCTQPDEAQHLEQAEQDKTEETVAHKEAQRILRMMEETVPSKKAQRIDQMEQDKPDATEMQRRAVEKLAEHAECNRLDAEAQKAETEADISMAIMQKAQSEEQEQNMGFETGQQRQDTEFQDQQQTMSDKEVKRVVKVDKTGHLVCDREGQEILDKKFEETMDKYMEQVPSMEAKKKEYMLRHWECATKSEEMGLRKQEIELQKQELQLRQERDKHEIEMQERKNTLEMQQDEHKRRMNSTLW